MSLNSLLGTQSSSNLLQNYNSSSITKGNASSGEISKDTIDKTINILISENKEVSPFLKTLQENFEKIDSDNSSSLSLEEINNYQNNNKQGFWQKLPEAVESVGLSLQKANATNLINNIKKYT